MTGITKELATQLLQLKCLTAVERRALADHAFGQMESRSAVCVWRRGHLASCETPHGRHRHVYEGAPPDFCPHCGGRVEVES